MSSASRPGPPGDEALTLPPTASLPGHSTVPAPPPAPPGGEQAPIPGYEVLGELGRGGMGVVFKALDVGLHRVVALKMILAGCHAGPVERARFKVEAEAVARLQHPNIVQVYQVGEADGRPFLALEFAGGGTLAEKLAGKPLPPAEAARLTETLARAMHAAHQRQIVHRDLKPGNILLAEDGTPKITDFGLAKQLDSQTDQTRTGAVLGTPEYMAPEQAEGKTGHIGPATDVYSLGAILYEMLTGRPPFRAATALDTVMQVTADEPLPPSKRSSSVPRDLETICLKCLEKQPGRRYASALELAEDCAAFLNGEAIRARPPGPLGRLLRWSARQPALATTLIALSFFYAIQLLCLLVLKVEGSDGFFHWFVTGLTVAWATGALLFQRLVRRPGWETLGTFAWASMDVLLLTVALWMANGPSSPLATGYLLLTGAAALRYRPGLVWFVNALSAAGYVFLAAWAALYRPDVAAKPHQAFIFLVMLGVQALVFHLLLRRLRNPAGS